MGRGLGSWQHAVLDMLEPSLAADNTTRGLTFTIGGRRAWHSVRGIDVILGPGIYDLDVVRDMLLDGIPVSDAHRHTRTEAISRAVRGLVRRGELEALRDLVPLDDYRAQGEYGNVPAGRIVALRDGTHLVYQGSRVRFVRRNGP